MTKAQIQVCSNPDCLEIYFTKVSCRMSSTGEYDHLIFPHNLSSSDYLFVYAAGENNVVILIQNTPDSADTTDFYMTDEDVVDNMGDDIIETMERKNSNICDDSDSSFWEKHEMDDDNYSLSIALGKIPEIKNVYVSLNQPIAKNIL